MLPSTAQRVPENTATHVNQDIRLAAEERIARIAAGGPEAIDRRLAELDREWDIERLLGANASTLSVVGAGLALFVDVWFALIPLVICGFLLQHALQGWCPPLPIFRRLGVRTQTEIAYERYAFKALRGDFAHLSAEGNGRFAATAGRALQVAQS